ncbi:unnamed protein product [Ixodes hexagonus]
MRALARTTTPLKWWSYSRKCRGTALWKRATQSPPQKCQVDCAVLMKTAHQPAPASAAVGFDPQPSTSGTSATGSRRGSTGSSSSSGSSGPHSTQPRGEKRKRPQAPTAAFFRAITEEQRLLRLGFQGSREREFSIRERELKLQEEAVQSQRELAKAVMAFLNKTTG